MPEAGSTPSINSADSSSNLAEVLKLAPPSAVLALADGTVFKGRSFGAAAVAVGEAVFNTAMTGYQEILTDPSYCRQLVTLTYPHIGNVGTNAEDAESAKIQAAGLIVRDGSQTAANFRSQAELSAYLIAHGVPAIDDIDTRQLTRLLRDDGSQSACLLALTPGEVITDAHIIEAQRQACAFKGMSGLDLAQVVSVSEPYEWNEPGWQLPGPTHPINPTHLSNGLVDEAPAVSAAVAANRNAKKPQWHVVAYDFGVKYNILRLLVDRGCRVTVVPAKTPAATVMAMQPDGVFLSNGPGDPEPCDYAIAATRAFIAAKLPVFGICLGHQLLALACGAKTIKMKFGHHGANHPVQDIHTKRVLITSQNHGFAVDAESLPDTLQLTHVSLFDGSVQGILHTEAPAFGFQGHPEASPGPQDVAELFDRFLQLMAKHQTRAIAA